jgi:hypothetical protein
VKAATAITQVFGDGVKLFAVAVEYATPVTARSQHTDLLGDVDKIDDRGKIRGSLEVNGALIRTCKVAIWKKERLPPAGGSLPAHPPQWRDPQRPLRVGVFVGFAVTD